MKINYIVSDLTKSATTKALKVAVCEAEKSLDSNIVVIVPETKSIIIEKELLSLSKNGAFANIFVYSFVRLLNRLNFVETDKIISKQTAVVLIRKIIFDNIDNLKCYKKTAKNINFAEKIYDTLQQFKSSEVSVEDLKLASMSCDGALKSKLEDIIFIYEEYEKLLSNKLYDDCDKLYLIKQFAKSSDFLKKSKVFVVGFDNVTFEMISVLEELAKNVKEITFSSVYFSEKRLDKYIQNNELFFKFRKVADNLKYPYSPEIAYSNKKGDFFAIENNLFLPNLKQFRYNGNVKIFEAKNKEQEIKYVATKIVSLLENGARLKDIGVLLLDVENDSKLLKQIFDEYKIGYFINQDYNVSNHYLILFLKLSFELYLSHLSKEKVLKFLKTMFFDIEKISEFENFVNENGLNYNDFLRPLSKDYEEQNKDFEYFVNILTKFQLFYHEFAEKIKKSNTAADYIKVVLFVINYFNVSETLTESSKFLLNIGRREESHINNVILSKIEDFLKMLNNFIGSMKMSVEEFLQIFLTGFSSIKLNLAPVSVDCIVVQNNTDGFFGIKNMFIIGADEDHFPMVISDSGIILDNEIEKANILSGKKIEPTTKEINAREKFSAFESLLEPTDRLFVSYSKQALDGSQNKPSTIFNRLKILFGESVVDKDFKYKKMVSVEALKKDFAKHIGQFYSNCFDNDELNYEYSLLRDGLGGYFAKHLNSLTNDFNDFSLCDFSGLYFSNNKVSASQFESYFQCPYMFFVNYGLRLKENKDAKLSKLDIGVILHKFGELFVKNIKHFNNYSEKILDEQISVFVDNIFEKFKINKNRNKAALKFVHDESIRFCKYLIKEQKISSFKAKYNEFAFFGDNSMVLNLKNNDKLFFEGKIDRIDEFGDYVRIIDYKTGDIDADLYSIYYGKKIQLISYLSAISQIKDKKVAGVFYLPVHSDYSKNAEKLDEKYKMNGFMLNDIEVLKYMDNSVSFDNPKSNLVPFAIKTTADLKNQNKFEISRLGQKFLTETEFELLKKYNEKLCEGAADEILTGFIEPAPLKKGLDEDSLPCNWCEYAGFCGLEKSKFASGRRCESGIEIKNFNEEVSE